MKKAQLYAQALYEASQNKAETELDGFFANMILKLKESHEYKLLPTITREFESLLTQKEKGNGTALVVRDALDAEKYIQELSKHGDTFSSSDTQIIEDTTIVGGYIARNARAMLDRSYKKGLLDMYKQLVK